MGRRLLSDLSTRFDLLPSIDIKSIALPLEADPVQALRFDADLREEASLWPPFSGLGGTHEAPPEISHALMSVVPAGTRWVEHCNGRAFGQCEYLLDPTFLRSEDGTSEERQQTMAYRIIHGDCLFADPSASDADIPWRCSSAALLSVGAEQIDSIDVAAARRGFSVAGMDELGLYKVDPQEDDYEAFIRLLGYLREFADRCRQVAARDLDLIVKLS